MRTLSGLVSEGFIWAVGITRPKPGSERLAALYITGLLAGTIVGVVTLFLFAVSHL
jgi:hypothetical protein